jgi:hypothetical protein
MAIPSVPGSLNHINTLCLAKRACEFQREYAIHIASLGHRRYVEP